VVYAENTVERVLGASRGVPERVAVDQLGSLQFVYKQGSTVTITFLPYHAFQC